MINVTIKAIQVNSKKLLWIRYPSDFTMTVRCGRFGTKKIPNGGLRYLILTGY